MQHATFHFGLECLKDTHFLLILMFTWTLKSAGFIKATVTDVRYLTRSKYSRSLVHKKTFGFI